MTLYYPFPTVTEGVSSRQSVWLDTAVIFNGKRTYIGRGRVSRINGGWNKMRIRNIRLIKKIFKLFKSTHLSSRGENVEIVISPRHRQKLQTNGARLVIEKRKKSKQLSAKRTDNSENPPPLCMGRCCLRHLVVDFDLLGWDWIMYPRKYIANYCSGSCSQQYMGAADQGRLESHSKIIQSMLSKLNVTETGSACVADSTTAVNLMYADIDGNIRTSQNSIRTVNSCKCS